MIFPGDKYKAGYEEGEHEILPNLLGITVKAEIDKQEFKGFLKTQYQFVNSLTDKTRFTVSYIIDIHNQALSHLYSFAGKLRTVNISKGGFLFPAAKFLPEAMKEFEIEFLNPLPDLYPDKQTLIKDISKVHAELLFIHPFREGNGRVARLLANLMAIKCGYDFLALKQIRNARFAEYIYAVQSAANKDYSGMESIIKDAFEPEPL